MKAPFLLESALRDKYGLPKGELVNLFPETAPTGPNSDVTLIPTPGDLTALRASSEVLLDPALQAEPRRFFSFLDEPPHDGRRCAGADVKRPPRLA